MLNDLPNLVEPIIRKAGDILLSYYHQQLTWKDKQENGFVTEADLASEKYLIEQLNKLLPEASFFAEESGKQGPGECRYCWVIDPLDGTTNFAYGIPYFCISIALTDHDEPIFGMLYLPLQNELFYAQKSKGAYLNAEPISVAEQRPLNRTLLFVGFPYEKGIAFLNTLHYLADISPRMYAFRHLGAIAVEQAYLACGRGDGIFFEDLAWWDVAAGLLLIKEAGGEVTTFEGTQITPTYRSYIGANKRIHEHLIEFFKANAQKDD
jgi:myo-inositol-1(or 4)-monophosphatase